MAYGDLQSQRSMALDATRNAAYDRALAGCVTADSVVLDLGAGIGIFGLLALRHGARRVYCVEPQDVGALAEELAAANGFSDRLTFLQGRIEEVELPEPVDVIVSAMTGNLLFNEDLLPTLFHARDRTLRSGGVLVPGAAAIDAVPVSAPATVARHLQSWSAEHLGLDLSAGRRYAANALVTRDRQLRDATPLGAPVEVFQLDLATGTYERLDVTVSLPVGQTGACDGVIAWLRLRLGDEWLSTGPFDPNVHWSPGLFPFDPPLAVEAGESLELRLTRAPFGDWAWRARLGSEVRQGSTFFARPRRYAAGSGGSDRTPIANRRAEAIAAVLTAMDGATTVAQLASMVATRFGDLFPTEERARAFVIRLVRVHARGS